MDAESAATAPDGALWDEAVREASAVLSCLRERGQTLACAESCTGGLIASALTEVPGSSDCFKGGAVSYWAEVKNSLLGVPRDVIEKKGVVSSECARAMAEGASRLLSCEYALSTTGIAGPGGAEPGKPVGTVWLGLSTPDGTCTELLHAEGDRGHVRLQAVVAALGMLSDELS